MAIPEDTGTGEHLAYKGDFNSSQRGTGLRVVRSRVHVNIHLHLVVQDLHELLHGWQVTRLQFGPNRHIWGNNGGVKLTTFSSVSLCKRRSLVVKNSPLNVISKAPVDISWFSIMLLRKNTIMQAYT